MARGESTEEERQEVAESLIGLSAKEKAQALEKLHSDYTINEWNDIYSRLMESDPQAQVRYTTPEDLGIPSMSDEDLANSIDGIDREQSDLTDAEKPIALDWIKKEMAQRKSKSEEPKYEIVNDKALDAIKDNFTPPGAIKEATDFLDNRIKSADKVIKSTKENLDKQGWDIDKEIAKGKRESELLKEGKKPSEVLETIKKEFDTNDNGEIEVDEMADFQKSLDDYASKNKKGREDIPARYRK